MQPKAPSKFLQDRMNSTALSMFTAGNLGEGLLFTLLYCSFYIIHSSVSNIKLKPLKKSELFQSHNKGSGDPVSSRDLFPKN